eukprot:9468044-Pyramimonas_sp.AAC.2
MKDIVQDQKPGSLSVEVKATVYFNIQDRLKVGSDGSVDGTSDGGDNSDSKKLKISFQNAGALVPIDSWANSPLLSIMWSCKWSPKGLVPVCPKVVIREALNIPAGSAVKLI